MVSYSIGIVDLEARSDPEMREMPSFALKQEVKLKPRGGNENFINDAEKVFGEGTWIDWGSQLFSGSYEQMCAFLDLADAAQECRNAIDAMPHDAIFGFVWVEHVWGNSY